MSESEGLAQIAQQMQELEQFANDLGLPPAPQLQDAEVSHEPENAHGDELVKFVLRSQRFDDRVCIARRLDILPPILRSSVKDVVRKAEFRFRGLKIPQRATADSLEASSDIPDVIQVVDIAAISVVVNSENGAYPPLTFVVAGGVPMQEIFQFYFTAYEVDRETVRFKLGRKTISPGDTTDTLKLMDKIRIRIMSVEEAEKEDEQDNITETVETPEPVNSKKRRRVRKPPSIRARTAIGSSSLPLKPRSQPPVPEEQEICLYLQKKSFPRRMYFVHPTAKLQHCMEMYEQGIGGERLVFYVHVGGKLRHIDRNQTPKEVSFLSTVLL